MTLGRSSFVRVDRAPPSQQPLQYKSCAQVPAVDKFVEAYFPPGAWWVGRILEMRNEELFARMITRIRTQKGKIPKKTPSFLSGSHMQNHALLRSVCSDRHGTCNWWELAG